MARVRPRRRWNCALWLACVGLPVAPWPDAHAQPPVADFGGARMTNPPVVGPVEFSGARVHSWREGSAQRLVMSGPVRVRLGAQTFVAKRAAAWTESLGDRTQVFVYLERVGDPAAPVGGQTLTAETLSVRGVFAPPAGVKVNADFLIENPPSPRSDEATLLAPAAAALSKAVDDISGRPTPEPPRPPLPTFAPRSGPTRDPRKLTLIPPRPAPPQPHTRTGVATTSSTGARPQRPSTSPPGATRTARSTPAPAPQSRPAPTEPTPGPVVAPAHPAPTPTPVTPPPPTAHADTGTPAGTESAGPAKPIFAKEGIVTLAPGDVTFVPGADENTVIASGGVTLQYADLALDRVLQLTARRAVIFLDPGKLEDVARFRAENVRGIYLEGDVTATDGTHTTRGPQVFYDLRANKGVMLDAVFWTYDEQRELPIYVRAKTIRQTAADTFTGEDARFTNSAFFNPELSIGASQVTVTRREAPAAETGPGAAPAAGGSTTWVEARNITGRLGGVPLFWWPNFSGDPESRILKDLRVESRSGSGVGVLSTLDMYALAGLKRPRDITADLLADYYFERGPALGARARWAQANQRGELQAYTVPFDSGTDVMKSGARIERDDEFRGMFLGEQRWKLDEEWVLMGEVSLISDEAFIDAFYEKMGENRREFTNRLAARRLRENSYFNAEVEGTFQDFIANEYLLESQGYSVTKAPEFTYIRQADDLLAPGRPGMLTWFSEYRVGRIEMAFDEALASEHGFTRDSLAQRALGVNANQSVADSLRAAGMTEEALTRADTRQELAATFNLGPVIINPFVAGRLTFWDSDFSTYSPDADENVRMWGAAGVRASTTVQRVYNGADSRLLDIHRLRHILEPNVTVWAGGTNLERQDLPVYDQDVEGILEGVMVRIGLNQYFQTQRGGPGRWHGVDLFTLSTDFVFSSDDTGERYPYGKFFDFRPEYSTPGDFFVLDGTMRLTDAASLTGSTVYDLDNGDQESTSVGALFRQYPTFAAAIDVRYLNPQDSTYITGALGYELTSKYSVAFGANYNTDESQFQTVSALVQRRFASMQLGIGISTNEISDDTGFFIVFRPYGAAGQFGFTGQGDTIGTRAGGL